ncbi:neurocalcin-delta B-like [Mercenaria mercenaria]|uniref:neurocalcin-delta B-like n=1 Tax=Mercenaria mercenaria TaxID=6596 RepID=UPI00234F4614|nr:neurocalcin-delta B-like [Mercenaria mercenaria]XP_053395168.1 neurocalcin-delta B-like [Mercenaria mercenaria]
MLKLNKRRTFKMGQQQGKFRQKKLKGPLLKELQKKVPGMKIDEIQQSYLDFRRETKGKDALKRSDFIRVYKNAFGDNVGSLANSIFDAFDEDGNGTVDFEEFLIGLSITEMSANTDKVSKMKRIRWAFNVYDKDRSGTIDKREMRQIVKAVADVSVLPEEALENNESPKKFADRLFKEIDVNGDGEITFEEFEAAAERNTALIEMLLPVPENDL